jgi:uncharacterized protein (TIGR03382 family)
VGQAAGLYLAMLCRGMRLSLVFAAALAPLAASAVTLSVNGAATDVFVGAGNCKTLQLTSTWDLQQTPTGSDRVLLIGTRNSSTCTNSAATTAPDQTFLNSTPAAQTQSFTVTASQMVLSSSDAGVTPCDDPDVAGHTSANPVINVLCVQYQLPNFLGGTPSISSAAVNIKYALARPLPPRNLSISPGDKHLRVGWSKGDDAEDIANFDVHVVPEGVVSDGGVAANVTSNNADVTQTDDKTPLQNDAGYSVYVVAHDRYGNISDPSDAAVGVPIAVSDFYNHYREAGGDATGGGGCSTGGGSFWIAFGALAMALLLRRRRKARNGAALVVLFALVAPRARAAEPPPKRLLVGLKMDRYDPKVDSEPGLTGTPYHDVFGPRAPPRYQLEVDWEVAHPFGSVLLGVTAGFWQNYGKAILRDTPPGLPPQRSTDTTTLNVIPFGVIATYRFDWLADRWPRFPFIPYAQAGLMRALWVSYNGTGSVSRDTAQGGRGSGWTNGYTTALGFAVSLNAIDLDLAREAYMDTGIQRTSFFAEYGWTYLNNFHKSGQLVLTDRAWRFGIAVEF